MLVACCLVNRATWEVAEPVLKEIKRRWPSVHAVGFVATPEELAEVIRPLGFQNGRASSINTMARQYWFRRPRTAADVLKLRGCGKYAADSWAIFVDGNLTVEPSDGKLNWYLAQTMAAGAHEAQ